MQTLGTIIGRTAAGDSRTVTVGKEGDRIELVTDMLERRDMALPDALDVAQLVDTAANWFGLSGARFVPAHGATGGKGTEEHLSAA